jgi:hypothetical protein
MGLIKMRLFRLFLDSFSLKNFFENLNWLDVEFVILLKSLKILKSVKPLNFRLKQA